MCFIEYFLHLFQQTKEDKMPQPNRVKQVELIQKHEALRLEAYMPTPHDKPTIGWGHTGTTKMGMKISMEQALALFRMDLTWVRKVIKGRVKVPLTQQQYDALASFIFNLGGANFKSSTMLKLLNAYDYVGAANEFPKWNKQRQNGKLVVLGGLTKRRAEERALFLKGTVK
tara:strand:+ start:291 stop:803 length:513 start_codon:yes stop_codon:yes gene_type:complete